MEYCTIYFFKHCSNTPPSFWMFRLQFFEGCCKKRVNVYCDKNRQNRRTSVEKYVSKILYNLENSTLKEPFCVNLMTISSQFYVKRSLPICNIFSPEVRSWAMCLAIFCYPTLLHFTFKDILIFVRRACNQAVHLALEEVESLGLSVVRAVA